MGRAGLFSPPFAKAQRAGYPAGFCPLLGRVCRDGTGFQPLVLRCAVTWGVASGWDGVGLWPLSDRPTVRKGAKGRAPC
jgi:hypothetical protein